MPFLTPDVPVTIRPDGTYQLTADVAYRGRDDLFTIPAGMVTDLASVPQFLTWLVPIQGIGDRAAILHDRLCTQLEAGDTRITAVDVDGIFRRVLRELDVPTVRRWLFWAGVRWGAAFTPARRPGWWSTFPALAGISVLALPIVLPASVLVGAGLAAYWVAETIARRTGRTTA